MNKHTVSQRFVGVFPKIHYPIIRGYISLELYAYSIDCLNFGLLTGLEVFECVEEPGILVWVLEPEIWARSNFFHHKLGPEASSLSEYVLVLTASSHGNPSDTTWFSLVLTNKNAYIRCKVQEFRSNPANVQWRTWVSDGCHFFEGWYVSCISQLGGRGFLCHLHKSTDLSGYSGEFVTIN